MEVLCSSNKGYKKKSNQDNFVVDSYMNRCNDETRYFSKGKHFIILDGMGGHDYGEICSNIASEIMIKRSEEVGKSSVRNFCELIKEISDAVYIQMQMLRLEEFRFSGTTIAGLYLDKENNKIRVYNVGDSRVYIMDKKLKQISYDDSLVNYLVSSGVLSQSASKDAPQPKNIIMNALGNSYFRQEKVHLFDIKQRFFKGKIKYFFLCSDGVSDYISDNELQKILKKHNSIEEKSKSINEIINSKGALDNYTYIIVKLDKDDLNKE